MVENSTPELPKPKPPAEPKEVIRDLIRPEDLEESAESDGPRDPTTQDRGDLFLTPTSESETETVRKPIVIEPPTDSPS